MFQRIGPAAFKKDLTNTLRLCEALGQPQTHFTSIHVAGTNGKGSVSNLLAAVFQASGYKTGLYTSPHLLDFRERIRVNGMCCPPEFVVDFVHQHQSLIEEVQPSFFEITVAMAFSYFKMEACDVAIIETGLGGRLDSTNIISPELSVITNIGWDHMNLLGDTLEAIAFEKAGIIKPKTPVIIGEYQPEIQHVFEQKASEQEAPLLLAKDLVQLHVTQNTFEGIWASAEFADGLTIEQLHTTLNGAYQEKNLTTALAACITLAKQFHITTTGIITGFAHVKALTGFSGRMELLSRNPMVIADCAHNVDGLQLLMRQIHVPDDGTLHIVFGTVNDKDPGPALQLLPRHAIYYFCKADIPRGMESENLRQEATKYELKGEALGSVHQAITAALSAAGKNDLIIICGSIFVVAEALDFFHQTNFSE